MANALQDQLLNIGLIDKKSAAQAKKDKYKKNKKNRNQKTPIADQNKILAQQQINEKKKQDRILNQQKQKQADLKAIKAQIKQLMESNSIYLLQSSEENKKPNIVEFNFQDKKLVKRIQVSDQIQKSLVNGTLAITKWEEKYHVVAKAVATKIAQRDESYIILLNTADERSEMLDNEYADYEIPDDLMW